MDVRTGGVLYVLDGRVLPPVSGANGGMPPEIRALGASDIASIEVLKGAAAIRRFGAAGENGVVLISTQAREQTAPGQSQRRD